MNNNSIDYYEILEVHPKASLEIIKKAYRTLAAKYHPDTTTEDKNIAAQKMILLNEAYEVLSNPDKRKTYDQQYFSKNNFQNESTTQQERNFRNKSTNQQGRSNTKHVNIEDQPAIQTCHQISRECSEKIIKKDGFQKQNHKICSQSLQLWSFYMLPLMRKINTEPANKNNHSLLCNEAATTLWIVAGAFTWADDYIAAKKLLQEGIGYIYNDAALFNKLNTSLAMVQKSINNLQSFSRTAKIKSKIKSYYFSNKQFFWVCAVIMLVFIMITPFLSPANKLVPPAVNKPQSLPVANISSPKIKPKTTIVTGYDKSFQQKHFNGLCRLTINNSAMGNDVHIKLVNNNKAIRVFFIKQGDIFTIESLPPGLYYFAYNIVGTDMSIKSQTFNLVQEETATGTTYSDNTISLYKVPNGNFHTSSISKSDFDQLL